MFRPRGANRSTSHVFMGNEAEKMVENDIDKRLQDLESQIVKINNRNLKVQTDKAWETSKFRILSICALTYVTISLVFWMVGVENALVNAIIPTLGFYLSTQSLPLLKKWWIERYFGK